MAEKSQKKPDRKMHIDKQHCFLDNVLYCESDFIEYWLNNDGCQIILSSYFTEYYGFFFPGMVQTNLSMYVYSKCSAISQFHNRKICLLITKMTRLHKAYFCLNFSTTVAQGINLEVM